MDLIEGFESAVPLPLTSNPPEEKLLELGATVVEFLKYVTRSQEHAAKLTEELLAQLPRDVAVNDTVRTAAFSRGIELATAEELPLPEPEFASQIEDDPFRAAVARLPFEYRVVFLLQDRYGFSRQELSGMLGWSPEVVQQLSFRARLMVRRNLLKYLNGESL